jgi:DNA primase
MNNDVEEIKARTNIVDIVGSYVTLKKAGTNYKGLCPFHNEKTPSFMVNPERQIYKCFGCSEGGDVLEFVQKQENLTFPEALRLLADKVGYQLTDWQRSKGNTQGSDEPDVKSQLYKINILATQVFHKVLSDPKLGQKALTYLKERGLTLDTIKTFRIGLAPDKPILQDFLTKRGFGLSELSGAGSPQRFRGRIMFPIEDVLGNVVGFTGRSLDPELQPKYFNTPETPIFHKSRVIYGLYQAKKPIRDKGYVVLLEGQMDVVLAHQAGITNAVASSGTALTQDHLRILRRYSENIVLSFDMDEAGQKATEKALQLAEGLGFVIKVALLPKPYKDAGEAVKADPEIFKTALKDAPFAMDWLFEKAFERINPEGSLTVIQKKQVAKAVLPYIALITDPIEQSHWVNHIAKRLGVPEKSVIEALDRVTKPKVEPAEPVTAAKPTTLSLTELLYGLLRLHPKEQAKYPDLYKTLQQEYTQDTRQLELAVEEYQKTIPPEEVSSEIDQLISRRQSTTREEVKTSFASQIAQAESSGDRDKVKELLKKLQEEIIK